MLLTPSSSCRMPHAACLAPAPVAPRARCILSTKAAPRQRRAARCAAAATEAVPLSLEKIVQSFQAVPDPMQRYKQLLFFATKLEPLPAEDHTPENKVKGCVSQVWVVPELRPDGRIYWRADSDSQLTKGLAALLVQGLSGCTPEEIVRVQPDFIGALGLAQSLTPSRNNGFLNMLKLMQKRALEVYVAQQAQQAAGLSTSAQPAEAPPASASAGAPPAASDAQGAASSSSSTPVADAIRARLTQGLSPLRLDVVDDSYKHAGHGGFRGSAGYSGETHFTVAVVSDAFGGLTSLKRHRLVYGLLGELMNNPVHALSLVTQTPEEAGL